MDQQWIGIKRATCSMSHNKLGICRLAAHTFIAQSTDSCVPGTRRPKGCTLPLPESGE